MKRHHLPGGRGKSLPPRGAGWFAGAVFIAALHVALFPCGAAEPAPQAQTAERRAIAFLAAEVPRWTRENQCFSCHNNGDAVRALAAAIEGGELPDRSPLAASLEFLAAPGRWDANGPDGPFKDQKLARIQFAAALAALHVARAVPDRALLRQAAPLVAELQADDGSWQSDAAGNLGSPVTYGRALSTSIAMRTLLAADPERYRAAIAKGRAWFEQAPIQNVLDASATLLALAGDDSAAAARQAAHARELIRQGESDSGGWGPFVNSSPEVFDTALVLLALRAHKRTDEGSQQIAHGRAYLIARQEADGGWPATTRPPGAESYAQRLSTTAWATQALLATRPKATPVGRRANP